MLNCAITFAQKENIKELINTAQYNFFEDYNFDNFEQTISQINEIDPDNGYSLIYKALNANDINETVNQYDQAIEKLKKDKNGQAIVYYLKGFIYEKEELYQKAIKIYDLSLNLKYNHNVLLNKIVCLEKLNRYQEAIEILEKIENPTAHDYNVISYCYLGLKDYQKSIEYLEKEIEMQSDPIEILNVKINMIEPLIGNGDYKRAIDNFVLAISNDFSFNENYFRNFLYCFFDNEEEYLIEQLNKYQIEGKNKIIYQNCVNQENIYKYALEEYLLNKSINACYYIANYFHKNRDYKQAIEWLETAREKATDTLTIDFWKAVYYYALKDNQQSKEIAQKIIEKEKAQENYIFISCCYAILGDKTNALEYINKLEENCLREKYFTYIIINDYPNAIKYLEEILENREMGIEYTKDDVKVFEEFYALPKVQELLKKYE